MRRDGPGGAVDHGATASSPYAPVTSDSGRWDVAISVIRSMRWVPLPIFSGIGALVVVVPLLTGAQFALQDTTLTLRAGVTVAVVGAAFALDDPADDMTRALPYPRTRVLTLRAAMALVAVALSCAVQYALAPLITAPGQPLPLMGLLLEPVTLTAWTLTAAAAATGRRSEGTGGVAAVPLLVLLVLGAAFLPNRLSLFAELFTPEFPASRWRWGVLLLTCALWRVTTRDNGLPPLLQRLRGVNPGR
ncbi:hypothetical protein [Streptomyces sp. UG1]|uniref:hypothetical protein n=1 Tax=Streptomyces sp. UG1 TaxID=3417652 RepID=UPI003CF1A4E2